MQTKPDTTTTTTARRWIDIGGKFYPDDIKTIRAWPMPDTDRCPECKRALHVDPDSDVYAACLPCDTFYECES